jgi:hypothetical protein
MNLPSIANLILLHDDFELHMIDYNEDMEFKYPEEKSELEVYSDSVMEQLCNELRISIPQTNFAMYAWNGISNLPWKLNEAHNLAFETNYISLFVPETGTMFRLRGENRRIILANNATYFGKRPYWVVNCHSEKQLNNVRVLEFVPGRPFFNLEKAITEEGFYQLPRLKDKSEFGIIGNCERIIAPASSDNYF